MRFQTLSQLRKFSQRDYGLDYEEALEMAYENAVSHIKALEKEIKKSLNPNPRRKSAR